MECISYLNDLIVEVNALKLMKENYNGTEKQQDIDLLIRKKEDLIYRCKSNLIKLSDNNICFRIYFHMLNGLNASRAVATVSQENFLKGIKPTSITSLWDYYRKLQKIIKV